MLKPVQNSCLIPCQSGSPGGYLSEQSETVNGGQGSAQLPFSTLSLLQGLLLVLCLFVAAPVLAHAGSNWFDEHAAASSSGSPSIRINLSEQKAYFYKGSQLVGVSLISSGKKGFRTSPGNFRVLAKRPNHRSSIYGSFVDRSTGRVVKADVDTRKHRRPPGTYYRGAKMNYYIRFNGGVGLHASGHVPRYPASHGCVRMPPHMARVFFRYSRVGMPVRVSY